MIIKHAQSRDRDIEELTALLALPHVGSATKRKIESEIRKILTLIDVLNEEKHLHTGRQSENGLRAYWPQETERLPAEVRGLLHSLEQASALDAGQREFVINALMFLPADEITADTAKVMTLLVLWAQNAELPVLVGDELMAALHGKATMH